MNNITIKILFLFLLSQTIWGQISPGELSEAHKNLEGMSNCTKCHVLGASVENFKCLDCHTEVDDLLKSNRGYHSSSGVKGKDCFECHGEHFGRDFDVIRFDEKKFDHSQTKFELTGKHSEIECSKCHTAKYIKIEKLKKRKKTFHGLELSCVSCHSDFHQGTLASNNCLDCHSTDAWRPAPLFSHETAKFKLDGAHQKVGCEKCHVKELIDDKEFQKFTGLKFDNCTNCHADIHKGKFGINCVECHTLNSFAVVKNLNAFDHTRTNYRLIGKHATVTCNRCHTKGIRAKLQHEKCVDCHNDFHKGDFVKDGAVEDCSKCHNEYGFTPAYFTIEQHNTKEFKLTGGHFAVPCNECHFVDSNWKFKFQDSGCETCHANIHKSSLVFDNKMLVNCETCHSTDKWSSTSFDHNKTKFELVGKHVDIACAKCHFSDINLPHQFVTVSPNCESCHVDIHNGQFVAKYKNNCSECHTPTNWLVENFDHSKARFIIDGAHKNVKCSECHKIKTKEGKKIIQYIFEDISCKNCHT
ncbi:MAG: cytochrome C [Melioribacteraceae bacterium]|nr:cytochrome C [Melioribacteraceae bacterium]